MENIKSVIYEYTGLRKDQIQDISIVALHTLYLVKVTVNEDTKYYAIPFHPHATVEHLCSITEEIEFEKI